MINPNAGNILADALERYDEEHREKKLQITIYEVDKKLSYEVKTEGFGSIYDGKEVAKEFLKSLYEELLELFY